MAIEVKICAPVVPESTNALFATELVAMLAVYEPAYGGFVRPPTTTVTTHPALRYAAVNDTPTYPDVFDGTDSNETVTTADIKRACLKLLASLPTDTTNSRDYWWSGVSLAAAYGGLVPSHHGLFVVHSTNANLDATEGNHNKSYRAAYMTSA